MKPQQYAAQVLKWMRTHAGDILPAAQGFWWVYEELYTEEQLIEMYEKENPPSQAPPQEMAKEGVCVPRVSPNQNEK